MKKIGLIICCLSLICNMTTAQEGSAPKKPADKKPVADKKPTDTKPVEKKPVDKKLTPAEEKAAVGKGSYGFGYNFARRNKREMGVIDLEMFIKGLKDALGGQKSAHTDEELQKAMQVLDSILREKAIAKAKENLAIGKAFLAKNLKAEGIVATKSGLQYKVLKAGKGKKPTPNDMVKVKYKGTLINGTTFDEGTHSFPVGRVIPGWTEALQLMNVGSKFQLFIPSEIGYGARGSGGDIEPNEVLIFEVELLEIIALPKRNVLPGLPPR